jgi:hypothetical protein
MPREVFCPRCRFAWQLDDQNPGTDLECQICGAARWLAEWRERRQPKANCPHCGKEGESFWRTCPYCEGVLGERPDDKRRFKGIMVALQVFGGIAFAIAVPAIIVGFASGNYKNPSFWVIGIVFLGFASMAITFWQTQDKPQERTISRLSGNFLMVLGGFVTSSCLLGVTYVVYLAISRNLGPGGPRGRSLPTNKTVEKEDGLYENAYENKTPDEPR